ncbi:hypothetical protein CC80DRAFT_495593 [Byssothecium circinans]|uniref:Uncharacterized protein n=1 Tax=Byssothecium circinans TaxID=147558 RepID=A0A6A5THN0_9PLEO|nr:hypothetical protein CC80DRAFT_495593 [Byssothecium circinans]
MDVPSTGVRAVLVVAALHKGRACRCPIPLHARIQKEKFHAKPLQEQCSDVDGRLGLGFGFQALCTAEHRSA